MRAFARHSNLIGLAVALVVALACGCHARVRRTPDDTLVYVLESYVSDLDPRYVNTSNEAKLSRLCAAGLVSVDQQSLEPKLELAERFDQIDPLTWDVTVRADARFPDGTALTSADVVYTFTSALDPALHSTSFHAFDERFAGVEAVSERVARFHLKSPLATFRSDLEFGIVEKKVADENGGRFPGGGVVGAGPFTPISVARDHVILGRNPNYFAGAPPLGRLDFRVIPDTNARLLMLVGGSADLGQNTVRVDLVDDVLERPRLAIQSGPSAILTYLLMNNDDPLLKDVRVREAIAYAIDREKILKVRFHGRAVLATGLVAPGHWAYEPDVEKYGYDPARARQLLDEAGYPAGPDGVRLSLVYKTSSDAFRVAVAHLIAEQLGQVGIEVEVRPFEFATFFDDVKRGRYQIATLQTSEIAEPDMYYNYFHSSRIPTDDFPNLANRWHYRSAEADRLMEEGRRELDRPKRKAIYSALQKLVARDLPVIPLWHEDNIAVINRDVQGFEVLPNARLSALARAWKKK
jgi:peptide/nickel transport system substrate-binding protein